MQILGTPAKKTYKTCQSGTVLVSSSANVTVSSIDVSKSILIVDGAFESATTEQSIGSTFAGKIVNSTTIQIVGGGSPTKSVSWKLIEFNNVKSKQSGAFTHNYSATERFNAITAVNEFKNLLVAKNYSLNPVNGGAGGVMLRSRVSGGNNLGFLINPAVSSQNDTIEWQLIEFK